MGEIGLKKGYFFFNWVKLVKNGQEKEKNCFAGTCSIRLWVKENFKTPELMKLGFLMYLVTHGDVQELCD